MSAWRPEWDEAAESGRRGGPQVGPISVPFWTKRLLIANAVIWLALYVLGTAGYAITDALAVNPGWWWTNPPFLPFWQPLTYAFLHDLSGPGHLLFNSISLFFFGSMLERAIGGRRFLTVYFGAALVGGLLHAVLGIMPTFAGPMVGASGAIMACIVASAVLFPRSQILLLFIPVPLWIGASILFALDLIGFGQVGGQVAHHVHLAGALFGFLYIKLGWHHRAAASPLEAIAAKKQDLQAKGRLKDDERMDELLARISREGMGSLSSSEKEFLKRMSKRG